MSPEEAQLVLETLAKGIDPSTGEVLPSDGVFDNPSVLRALFFGIKALDKAATVDRLNPSVPAMAGKPWTSDEENQLLRGYDAKLSIEELSASHSRSKGGIAARLVRLGRINDRSDVYSRKQQPTARE